jgi:hypothetical protein
MIDTLPRFADSVDVGDTRDDNSTSIEIWQTTTDETITFTVARERALDAFRAHARDAQRYPRFRGFEFECCSTVRR